MVTLEIELAQKSLVLIAWAIKKMPDEPAQMFSLANDFAVVYTDLHFTVYSYSKTII